MVAVARLRANVIRASPCSPIFCVLYHPDGGSHGRPQEREVPDASRARSVRAGLRADEGRHRESRRAPADRYSRWDEYVAIHRFIQNANTPANNNVNFGHGGLGAYGFLSWHRYFLYRLEQQLQTYVPGVMLPSWDWTDPVGTIVVEDFLGPNGDPLSSNEVRLGYFATEAPGTGANTTPVPAWWPAGLTGWNLARDVRRLGRARSGAISSRRRACRRSRRCGPRSTWRTYSAFQNALDPARARRRSISCTTACMAGSAAAATWAASRSRRSTRCSTCITATATASGRCGRWTGTPTNTPSPAAIRSTTETIRCTRGWARWRATPPTTRSRRSSCPISPRWA